MGEEERPGGGGGGKRGEEVEEEEQPQAFFPSYLKKKMSLKTKKGLKGQGPISLTIDRETRSSEGNFPSSRSTTWILFIAETREHLLISLYNIISYACMMENLTKSTYSRDIIKGR